MKVMLTAFAVTAIISVVAYFGLHEAGFGAGERTASTAGLTPDRVWNGAFIAEIAQKQ